MSIKILRCLIFFAAILCSAELRAAHLVGGEISYRCLGNNDYEITMIIYRDGMSTGAQFDPTATITVYNTNNMIVANLQVPLLSISNLPLSAPNNCTSLPNNVATEKGIYIDTINLPPTPGGYTITHQRCCRNNTISNINNATSQWGSTYTTSIPSMDNCNSSPKFNGDPPVVLCVNQDVSLDLSATDINGDSLYYELCNALHGGANAGALIKPDPAAPPPYSPVQFIPGFSKTYPITSSPAFSIDHSTGNLTGRPTQTGQYVFAVCVSEYKNGNLLSTTRRDFQFNISNACKIILSRVETPEGDILMYDDSVNASQNPVMICTGKQVDFLSRSQFANQYYWNFGVIGLQSDTSRLPNPTYYYRDTGTYLVTHVAEPFSPCADTSYVVYKVQDSLYVKFSFRGENCFSINSFEFDLRGNFSSQAVVTWDFGGNTNVGIQSNGVDPGVVSFNQPGKYVVKVHVKNFSCERSYFELVEVFEDPVIMEEVEQASACAPFRVQFTDKSITSGRVQHFWYFGDGYSSNMESPEHVYRRPGTYSVEHIIKTFDGCIATKSSFYQDVITVLPLPTSAIEVSTEEASIYDPSFLVTNRSQNHIHTKTILPDGRVIENMEEEFLVLQDTGNYDIIHISTNEYGCTDTLVKQIRVDAPFNLFLPSAFTPNDDGVNDQYEFAITDFNWIEFEIYNRYGETVFQTTDANAKWNGKHFNTGPDLPPGVYSYVFIANVKSGSYDHVEKGVIHLIR